MEDVPIWGPSQPTRAQPSQRPWRLCPGPGGSHTSVVWQRTVRGDGDEDGWQTGVWLLPVSHRRAGQAARPPVPPVLAKKKKKIGYGCVSMLCPEILQRRKEEEEGRRVCVLAIAF